MDENLEYRSGFVALVGRPNSGKSTLLNAVVGEKLSIVTPLPQTTRRNLRGIYSEEKLQLVFVDTPGIHKGKYTLNDAMTAQGRVLLEKGNLDLVCYLVDLSRSFGDEEDLVASTVASCPAEALVVFNKADVCADPDGRIREFGLRYPALAEAASITISAISSEAPKAFLDLVRTKVPVGPQYYPDEDLTDASLRFLAAEFIRKEIIGATSEEVPHAAFVEISSYREGENRHRVEADIHVETKGQKGILIGASGAVVKKIQRGAECALRNLTGVSASVRCHVKVTPGWRDNDRFLSNNGLST